MMAFNVVYSLAVLALVATVNADAVSTVDAGESGKNPIRRVVSMLQMMTKKIEAEAKKEEELYDKFMCYCKTGEETLGKSIADNDAKIPQVQSDIEESTAKMATTTAEIKEHQTDRDSAKAAMAKATAIREKEHAEFLKESSATKANIDALAKAIPAIEKGMGGGFLQTSAAQLIKRVALSDVDLSDFDRDAVTSFLEGTAVGSESYVPKSGQIVGILKQMKDDFDKDYAALVTAEDDAQKIYDELIAAKTKEVETHTAALEKKHQLVGELGISIAMMKNELTDAEEAKIEDSKFLQDLDKNCAAKEKEWDERCKTRSEELVALAETIKILNDDDALELFKKTLPSPSLLQVISKSDTVRRKAMEILKEARRTHKIHDPTGVDFIELALTGKKVDFSKVIKMIDDMVVLLAKEQQDDDHKKEYCETQLDFAEDKAKELQHAIDDLDKTIADTEETIKTVTEDLKTLEDGIKALDDSVLEATKQRRSENAEYKELMAGNTAAKELIEFAKNRMQKFYNPKLYKPPPKRELTEEEKIYTSMGGELEATPAPGGIAGTGVGLLQHKDPLEPPPKTFGAYKKKGEESGGVLAMMDNLVKELDKEMTEAEVEEKDAQGDYEQMMNDAAQKRSDDSKAIVEKQSAKAQAETDHSAATDTKKETGEELQATKSYLHDLHQECDWLLQNYDLRKTARAEETDALKKAKAVLSGADFSLMQVKIGQHKM
jgi:chromosome segregation ATPase